ncbi:hypothetical protein [Brucella intermedia]|uniref:hypothetical protein n=1 Tax=Brucella intermedia TaxID=94625 RepID=UPI000DE22F02|nr:hypothetical protein [Brucella intermedia]MPR61285.1 hypothetical protein [Brucella intermedia]
MNRFLAETLSFLNGIIAAVIVLAGAYLGFRASYGNLFASLLGAMMGIVVAALACGVISYLALIESHLAKIAGQPTHVRDNPPLRKEPSL